MPNDHQHEAHEPLLAPTPVPLSSISHTLLHSSSIGSGLTVDPNYDHRTHAGAGDARAIRIEPSPPPSPAATLSSSPRVYILSLLPAPARDFINANVGLSLVACAQLFFVLMNLTVKYFLSTTRISALTLIFVRMGITALFCVSSLRFVLHDPDPILGPPGIRRMLMLRGFIGFVGLLAGYQSLRGLTVSDSVTIQFLSPTVTAVLGYLFLRETMTWREVVAGFCCLSGVVLVSRPPFLFGGRGEDALPPDEHGGTRLDLPPPPVLPGEGDTEGIETPERAVSVCWALVLVMTTSLAMITIRKIGNKANALHSIGYFAYMCTISCGLYLLFDPHPLVFVESVTDLLFIIAIGIFGFCAQTLLTLGLQREKAGRAGLATYLQVVFALVLEFLLWQTIPSFLSALGTTIILTSAFWAASSSTVPSAGPTKQPDPEALPFSRSPSPIPPPHSNRPTLRGAHYSYDSVPAQNEADSHERGPERKGSRSEDGLLDIPYAASGRASPSRGASSTGASDGGRIATRSPLESVFRVQSQDGSPISADGSRSRAGSSSVSGEDPAGIEARN